VVDEPASRRGQPLAARLVRGTKRLVVDLLFAEQAAEAESDRDRLLGLATSVSKLSLLVQLPCGRLAMQSRFDRELANPFTVPGVEIFSRVRTLGRGKGLADPGNETRTRGLLSFLAVLFQPLDAQANVVV
jgi:hypothetical protein